MKLSDLIQKNFSEAVDSIAEITAEKRLLKKAQLPNTAVPAATASLATLTSAPALRLAGWVGRTVPALQPSALRAALAWQTNPELRTGLIGAGIGAGAGLVGNLALAKKKKPISSAFLGSLLGGGLGWAYEGVPRLVRSIRAGPVEEQLQVARRQLPVLRADRNRLRMTSGHSSFPGFSPDGFFSPVDEYGWPRAPTLLNLAAGLNIPYAALEDLRSGRGLQGMTHLIPDPILTLNNLHTHAATAAETAAASRLYSLFRTNPSLIRERLDAADPVLGNLYRQALHNHPILARLQGSTFLRHLLPSIVARGAESTLSAGTLQQMIDALPAGPNATAAERIRETLREMARRPTQNQPSRFRGGTVPAVLTDDQMAQLTEVMNSPTAEARIERAMHQPLIKKRLPWLRKWLGLSTAPVPVPAPGLPLGQATLRSADLRQALAVQRRALPPHLLRNRFFGLHLPAQLLTNWALRSHQAAENYATAAAASRTQEQQLLQQISELENRIRSRRGP